MNLLRALLLLSLALVFQAALGRVWPTGHLYVNALLVPVVLYGAAGQQRSAMLVGCAAGLLTDAWFGLATLGLNGFKQTLLGWSLGGSATRLDLNHQGGRMGCGILLSLADDLLDLALRWILELQPQVRHPLPLVTRALVTGLLAAAMGAILDRVTGARRARPLV